MLDILKFIFTDWKTFFGTILLLIVIGDCFVVNICNTFIKYFNAKYVLPNIKHDNKNKESEDK